MEVGKLYVVWKDKWNGHNVYRVDGTIEFEDGFVSFKKLDGDMVKVEVGQIVRVGLSGMVNLDKYKKNH